MKYSSLLDAGSLGGAGMIILSGMGLLLIGSVVWHEIQVWRGKRR